MTEAWLGLIASDSFSSQQKHCSPAAGRGSIQGFREHTQTWTKTEGFSSATCVPPSHTHPYFELIRDFRHERGDLLHEPVNAALAAGFQQRGDGQGGYAAVGVCHEVLQVQVTGSHSGRVFHGHLERKGKSGRSLYACKKPS